MIQVEPRAAGPVMVYTEQRGMTGAMRYYLEQANERRFQVERVDELDEVEGEYLWVLGRNEVDPSRKSGLSEGIRWERGLTTAKPSCFLYGGRDLSVGYSLTRRAR